MAPYRSALTQDAAHAPRDQGIVGDIIDQFADPYAFLRELVQNAIDADTPAVTVTVATNAATGAAVVGVRDRGAGMPRDVLENRLLVLFRSTKEHDDTKIGKFGVGFASVLAMEPTIIRVDTVHAGARHVLHLYPDLRYELFDAGRATATGTTVELEVPVAADGVEDFVATCERSLERWCRHATVPIEFIATGDGERELARRRIDRPLAVDGAVAQARATSADGTTAVVGIAADAAPYAGFFNHGLTLYETTYPLLGKLAVKIQDPRLGHTLSRDNVRRDDAFDRAVAFARRVAATQLPIAAARALRDAAEANDGPRYTAVSDAVLAAGVDVPAHRWAFPLVDPVGGTRAIDGVAFAAGGGWIAGGPSALTRALASAGVPVVNLGAGGAVHARRFAADIQAICGRGARDVHAELVLVATVEPSGADAALIEALERLLGDCYRKPSSVGIARLTGVRAGELFIAGTADAGPFGPVTVDGRPAQIASHKDAARDPFRLLGRPSLVLNERAPHVARARARAHTDVAGAASLLCRAVLLARGALDEDRSAALLERGLAALDGELS